MSNKVEVSQYGISTTFEKVLAHNVPGIFLVAVLFMFLDIISQEKIFEYIVKSLDLKMATLLLFTLIYLSFIFGLIIDELHHVLLEEKVYIPIAEKKGEEVTFKDLDGNECSESYYLPFMGLDLYKYNLKHFYSYCEFDANISLVLFPTSVIFPLFINYYFSISKPILWGVGIAIFILAVGMIYCGYTAFCDYYSAFRNTLRGVLKKQEIARSSADSTMPNRG